MYGISFCGVCCLENNGYITREEFHNELSGIKQDISNLYSKANTVDRRTTAVETLIANWKDVPGAISNLDKTLALMQQNLEALNNKLDDHIKDAETRDKKQDDIMRMMGENSKIDIIKTIKDNWWKLCVAIAAVIYFVEPYISKLVEKSM